MDSLKKKWIGWKDAGRAGRAEGRTGEFTLVAREVHRTTPPTEDVAFYRRYDSTDDSAAFLNRYDPFLLLTQAQLAFHNRLPLLWLAILFTDF